MQVGGFLPERSQEGGAPPVVEELASRPTLAQALERVVRHFSAHDHPYIQWVDARSTDREAFRATQVALRFAIESLSQAHAATVARLPRFEQRSTLLDGIYQQHGNGNVWSSRRASLLRELRALGANAVELERPCPAAVRAFSQSLLGFCLIQPAESSAALLGIVELLHASFSARMAATARARGWGAGPAAAEEEEPDETLLGLAESGWRDASARAQVALGLLLGAHWLSSLYRDLLPR